MGKRLTAHGTVYDDVLTAELKQARTQGFTQAATQDCTQDRTEEVSETKAVDGSSVQEDLTKQQALQVVSVKQQDLEQETHLLELINEEVVKEQERNKQLLGLENARKNAIDAARATYGAEANVDAIMAYYDGMASVIDPKVTDVTDLISLSLDNLLQEQDSVKVLMTNGSVRVMNREVAAALVAVPMAKDKVRPNLPEKEVPSYSEKVQAALRSLSDLMSENAKRQAEFAAKAPSSGPIDLEKTREARFKRLGLPTVAQEYDYIYEMDRSMHGRMLPSAMYSYTMQKELAQGDRTYGL